jgi:hypothetical protein
MINVPTNQSAEQSQKARIKGKTPELRRMVISLSFDSLAELRNNSAISKMKSSNWCYSSRSCQATMAKLCCGWGQQFGTARPCR